MKLSSNVLTFAAGNMKLFEQFQDYWNHYRATELKKSAEYDHSISFAEKEQKLNAALVKEVIRRSGVNYATESNIGEWFYHPLVQHELFAVVGAMVEAILPESIIESIGLYTDIRQIGFGDSASFDIEPKDLFAVSKAGRAQKNAEIHKQYKGQVTVVPENHQLDVAVSLYRVLAGMDSLAQLVNKVARSMESQITLEAYTLFASTMAALSSTTTTGLLVSGYTQASLVRLCQQVTAWNQGSKAVVVGTQGALVNVLPDDANYRYTLNDEYMTLGFVKTAFGFDVLALPQVAGIATPWSLALSDSYIWILSPSSQKLLKLVLEGNIIAFTDNPMDRANLQQQSTMMKAWGLAVCTNSVAGTISL